MEEQVKIIEIPNFLTVKIVKINDKYAAYYVEKFSNEYFYVDKFDYLITHTKASISYVLSSIIPFTISIINVEHLENAINKLHKELTKGKLIRAEKGQKYYVIASDFKVAINIETNTTYANDLYKLHNYFLSKSQAEQFASKLQEHLIELWKEEAVKKENKNGRSI